MNENRCVCCDITIPEGRMVCPLCEGVYIKVGKILQSRNTSDEEVKMAYNSLNKTTEEEDYDA